MDINTYFRKKREIENSIEQAFVIVFSLETNDGGKEGQLTEVSRSNAARLIVEQRARLATETESHLYYDTEAKAREFAQQNASGRVPVAVLSEQELRSLRSSLRPQQKG